MTALPPLPDDVTLIATRTSLHVLAEKTAAAEQFAAIGTVRLSVIDGGFATRWFDGTDGRTRLSVVGGELLRETDSDTRREPVPQPHDATAGSALTAWWSLGWQVLHTVTARPGEQLSEVVLWPEHFDVGTTLTLADGRHLNLGFSPGDEFSAEPYLYAGPWEEHDGEFWNAPFGAYRTYTEVRDGLDPATLFDAARAAYGAAE
jgi:hypothetical protein